MGGRELGRPRRALALTIRAGRDARPPRAARLPIEHSPQHGRSAGALFPGPERWSPRVRHGAANHRNRVIVEGGMSVSRTTDADYVLGRTDAEHRRLVQQAAFLRPSTERMLRAAGVGPGMRVLDVGCGMGDVSFLVAEIVGPSGSVVGIDLDAHALAVAEQRRTAMTLANVSFVHGDFRSAKL